MADPDKPSDIDKLLAEVDSALGGKAVSPAAPNRAAARSADPAGGSLRERAAARVATALTAATTAAVVVGVLFAILPFLGMISGAAGAFVATFVAVLVRRDRA